MSGWIRLKKLAAWWDVVEQTVLGLFVVGMVVLSTAQIVLRNFFHTGVAWIEPLLGTSVLWITMLGALAATGASKHINVDLASHILPPRPRAVLRALNHLFAAVVCALLVGAGVRYVAYQKEMATVLFLRVPAWAAYAVMPACFTMIAARFLLHAALALRDVRSGARPGGAEGAPGCAPLGARPQAGLGEK